MKMENHREVNGKTFHRLLLPVMWKMLSLVIDVFGLLSSNFLFTRFQMTRMMKLKQTIIGTPQMLATEMATA